MPGQLLEEVLAQRGVRFEVPDAMEEQRPVALQVLLDCIVSLLTETPDEVEFIHGSLTPPWSAVLPPPLGSLSY